ncbi:MAG: epoxyqueuosine reductase QueH [Fastidiosipilaceae bacterium]|jgi:predicted adenine nucleotide alpha hydrolase (AANH) superfamily ATPase|nr:epoxyqueuosine reductase QueH [Clostridiaceae bacterium]
MTTVNTDKISFHHVDRDSIADSGLVSPTCAEPVKLPQAILGSNDSEPIVPATKDLIRVKKTSDLVRGQETRAAASDPKILLHICCAPCATYPVAYLRSELGMEPTGYFYNPNIHPQFEYQRRLDTFQNWAADSGIDYYLQSDCDEGRWRSFPTKQKQIHCRTCYSLRFAEACRHAAAEGFAYFTSTLFVSPYQDHLLMRQIAYQMADRWGIKFLDIDFRPGYRFGQQMARESGMYRQRYCGCIYSLGESNFKDKILTQVGLTAADIPDREV